MLHLIFLSVYTCNESTYIMSVYTSDESIYTCVKCIHVYRVYIWVMHTPVISVSMEQVHILGAG